MVKCGIWDIPRLSVDTLDAGNWVTQLRPLARHDGTCRPNFFPLSAQFLLSRGVVSADPWHLDSPARPNLSTEGAVSTEWAAVP